MTEPLTILLARPRGFCAGVERAIDIVEKALVMYGAPIYVRHEIVHNKWVVDNLRTKGVVFVDEVDEVPEGAITIFSAHGIAGAVEAQARARGLPVIDATCPLVTKVHREAQRYEKDARELILIGHKGHPEVEGTMGRVRGPVHLVGSVAEADSLQVERPQHLAYVTQTTLSVDDTRDIIAALTRRFPGIAGPDLRDICYATQNRQNAVRALAERVQVLLVIGSVNSSNSNRLRDLGQENGIASYLIEDESAIKPAWLNGVSHIGITAGASAPEHLVEDVVAHLSRLRPARIETLDGAIENTRFKLPPEVTDAPFPAKITL